jgi:L-lactate dehydrogenase
MDTKSYNPIRIAIVGAGRVGSTCAYALLLRGLASEIVLINERPDRAVGEAMDLNHGSIFASPAQVWAGEYADCREAAIVVLAAGAAQAPGETRLDLVKRNAGLISAITPQIVRHTRQAILIVVTNPVDVLTYAAWKASGLPARQVIGTGTILDTARFRYLLSRQYQVEPRSVHAYVVGEHGDSQVPVWSLANIAGIRLDEFCHTAGGRLDAAVKAKIAGQTRRAAYEIIRRKGATYYAIAAGVARIIEAIVRNENSVLTVSTLVQGEHALAQVSLSLPSIVNRQGIGRVLDLPLHPGERLALEASAQVIRRAIEATEPLPNPGQTAPGLAGARPLDGFQGAARFAERVASSP